jgi:hypothetical protein
VDELLTRTFQATDQKGKPWQIQVWMQPSMEKLPSLFAAAGTLRLAGTQDVLHRLAKGRYARANGDTILCDDPDAP